jgi:hypothetical protein
MTAAFTERHVLEIWQDSLQDRTDLLTEADEPVAIIYPGRRNDDRGADLRDAVIATRQGVRQGDIEIHVKTSDWWTHHHDRDPAYNRVILHVVYRNDAGKAITLQNGCEVPTLALQSYVEKPADRSSAPFSLAPPSLPCRGTFYRRHPGLVGEVLDEAGAQRFLLKAACFQETAIQAGEGQTLYQGIMTALGYAKNKEAMAELARRMPLQKLEATASCKISDIEYLAQCQARLMGTAGLLPSQRVARHQADNHADEWADRLESTWAAGGETIPMSIDDWRFFKVRPGNYPSRRIAAMSHLLLRYREKGLLAGLEGSFKEAAENGDRRLEQALLVGLDGYWGCHLDFGLWGGGIVPALLGRERAANIVVNVLLPFAFTRGRATGQPELTEKAWEIYRDYPAPAGNALEKHMRQQLGIGRYFANSARRQQGLIHLYQTRCSQGKCQECPLSELMER